VVLELSKCSLKGKDNIRSAFQSCRNQTLKLLSQMDDIVFCQQVHPDFSPIGWHFGHIAYTESLWLLERGAGQDCLFPEYNQLFAADGLPKSQRIKLPTIQETCFYLDAVRKKLLDRLEFIDEATDIEADPRLWWFILQHECQHCETIIFLFELIKQNLYSSELKQVLSSYKSTDQAKIIQSIPDEMIKITAGEFLMGSNSIDALDNEKPAYFLYLDSYFIDKYPVSCQQYNSFMIAGGYENPDWWSDSGWEWLQSTKVKTPLYWNDRMNKKNDPVCGVSWYEAEAYTRFVGKRLPTEAEWEKASCWDPQLMLTKTYSRNTSKSWAEFSDFGSTISPATTKSSQSVCNMLGNVWEWTDSWFAGYDGFTHYPYKGYSQVYFDGKHRVLKGGSWATRSFALRPSFRNWYYPHVRQIFSGFRCAKSDI
jgi:gamma-glutamyl hercynylcysteine S-oxide synthase